MEYLVAWYGNAGTGLWTRKAIRRSSGEERIRSGRVGRVEYKNRREPTFAIPHHGEPSRRTALTSRRTNTQPERRLRPRRHPDLSRSTSTEVSSLISYWTSAMRSSLT